MCRVITLALTIFVLINVHYSPTLILFGCCLLCGGAAYIHYTVMTEVCLRVLSFIGSLWRNICMCVGGYGNSERGGGGQRCNWRYEG